MDAAADMRAHRIQAARWRRSRAVGRRGHAAIAAMPRKRSCPILAMPRLTRTTSRRTTTKKCSESEPPPFTSTISRATSQCVHTFMAGAECAWSCMRASSSRACEALRRSRPADRPSSDKRPRCGCALRDQRFPRAPGVRRPRSLDRCHRRAAAPGHQSVLPSDHVGVASPEDRASIRRSEGAGSRDAHDGSDTSASTRPSWSGGRRSSTSSAMPMSTFLPANASGAPTRWNSPDQAALAVAWAGDG